MKTALANRLVLYHQTLVLIVCILGIGLFPAVAYLVSFLTSNYTICALAGLLTSLPILIFSIHAFNLWWIKWAIRKVGDIFIIEQAIERAKISHLFNDYITKYKKLNPPKEKKFIDFIDDPSVPQQIVIYYRTIAAIIAAYVSICSAIGFILSTTRENTSTILYFSSAAVLLTTAYFSYYKIRHSSKKLTLSDEGIMIYNSLFRWSWISAYRVFWTPQPELRFIYNGKQHVTSLEQIAIPRWKVDHFLAVYFGRAMKNTRYDTWTSLHNNKLFIVEEDHPTIGTYLLIFEDNVCIENYTRLNANTCKLLALEEYGVPLSSWKLQET